ncbi:transcription factor GTE8 isoform X2 [Jatropha curcas]|uniref:transcription factor GTE8 isoform X2 n=1 Tax=Jatropha curcas TaxID=180498 RepID=UPI0009D70B51|nr:transcription factor GTE8 isoform X2 [Jatropha curcas]
MAKNDKLHGEFYRNAFEAVGEMEGSGSSGRIDTEITASEDSSAPTRKCINLNSNKRDQFDVPLQVLSLLHMLPSERKDLICRLRFELEQIRLLQKKVEMQRTNAVTLSSSSDILSCSNGTNGPRAVTFSKSSVMASGPGKKANPTAKGREWNRNSSGRFKSTKQASAPSTTNVMVMKQCETLLNRLMSHQYGWVFNEPVDIVKLNIPDYLNIIKQPMDLGTIKQKLVSGMCSSPWDFLRDVRLTFKNAMEYNPKGHDVHIMAETLSKFFEVRWKNIEKKLPKTDAPALQAKSGPRENLQVTEISPIKKRKITSYQHEVVPEPVRRVMTDDEKQNLGNELESLLAEMPVHIIDFLKEHSSNGKDAGEDEIEIDIDDLSDDTLFTLRKLLDDYLQEKQKSQVRGEPCEIELLNESGLSNSSMQQQKGNDPADEDIDIGGNEPPVTSFPPVQIEKDTGHKGSKCISSGSSSDSDSDSSSESESDDAKASSPITATKVPENLGSGVQLDDKANAFDPLEINQSVSGLDQLEQSSQQKPSSVESDCRQDGDSAPSERQVSPEKLIRAAILKNRFADTILKAREKTLSQVDKGDPEKLKREMEELEMQKKKEKARLQAEAKAAEDARRQAEAAAAAEARRKRELEREAARQALLQMERTVEINENARLLEDLEMLRSAPAEHLPSSVDETSPDHSQDGLGGFRFGGSNPLEQLGLFMKQDDEEEEGEPLDVPNPVNDVEEGEID